MRVSDLQTDIVVGEDSITGTLDYVTDFVDFSDTPTLQDGNFLALNIDTDTEKDYTITAQLTGSSLTNTQDPIIITQDSELEDHIAIFRINNPEEEAIKVVLVIDGQDSIVKNYSLEGLLCETESFEFNLTTYGALQTDTVLNQLVSALQNDDILVTSTGQTEDRTADITGTLKYMLSFSDFSENPELQVGNFLALNIEWLPKDADVTIEVDEDGTKYEILNKDENGNFVIRITELTGEITITLEYHSYVAVWKFNLTGLILTPAS